MDAGYPVAVHVLRLVAQNVSDKPNYFPDTIRALSIVIFGIWGAIQTAT
jgi:hypothetical protein